MHKIRLLGYLKVCNINYAQACFSLDEIYKSGQGVEKTPEISISYYQKSCSLGFEKACKKQ